MQREKTQERRKCKEGIVYVEELKGIKYLSAWHGLRKTLNAKGAPSPIKGGAEGTFWVLEDFLCSSLFRALLRSSSSTISI